MVDIRHLRYFLAVAEELSFSRAAQTLHITQPALSESIRELEGEIGTELFVRAGRQISLTWSGETLRDEARRILRMLDDAVRLARGAGTVGVHPLRVGVIDDRRPGLLSMALARAQQLLPHVRLTLHGLPTAQQLRALAADYIDIGLVIGPVDAPGITAEALWSECLVAAVWRGHRLAAQPTARVADFRGEDLILPDKQLSPGYHQIIHCLCQARGFQPQTTEHASHLDGWVTMVEARIGAAFVPASLDTSRHAGVVTLRLTDPEATIPVLAAWRDANPMPALSAFVAALKSSRLDAKAGPLVPHVGARATQDVAHGQPASGQTHDQPLGRR